jgi:predicted amidohydrolase YtcJ
VFVGDARDSDAPADAERLDAGGRRVVPGFSDAHVHLLTTGYAMSAVDLKGVMSVEDALGRVAVRAAGTPEGAWIRGAGWDQHLWPGGRFPTRHQLDSVAPEHPVLLDHTSGHCAWVNSRALRAAGVTAETEAPVGGAIDRDDTGEPSGILRDNASRLVAGVIPHPTPDERLAALREAIAHAHRLGVTCVHAMNVGRGEYQSMLALRDAGRLRLRIRVYVTADRLDEWIDRNVRTHDGDDMMRIGGVKFFSDGALGSLTAWMHEPYEGSDDTGFALQPPAELEAAVRRCLEVGLAPAVHAIGDRANTEALDIFERLRGVSPGLPRRMEHAQLLREADIPRFGALGVVASVQPIHATQDMAKADRYWGARTAGAYPFASLIAAGASLAFGSDTPVETMDPVAGLHAAVTRRNAAGEPATGWHPAQRVSVETALALYTAGPAYAARDDGLGRIAPGFLGDCVILSSDPLAAGDEMRLLETRAAATIVGGELVHHGHGFE